MMRREHGLHRDRFAVGDMSLSWVTAVCNGKSQCNVASIDLLVPRDADRPLQTALAERVPERRAQAIAGISQHASEMHAGRSHPVDSSMAISGLLRNAWRSTGTRAVSIRTASLVQLSGRNSWL